MTGSRSNRLLSILQSLDRSERLSPSHIEQLQFKRLEILLAHANHHAAFYRKRLAATGYVEGSALTPEMWRRLPVLERADVQSNGDDLCSRVLPANYRIAGKVHSSGSTGRPIRVVKTNFELLVHEAITLRALRWHTRGTTGTLAAVRWYPDGVAAPPDGFRMPNWGPPISYVYSTGPAWTLSIAASSAQQARWLGEVQPDYLVAFPSLLPELARECRQQGITLARLKQIRTLSECVDTATRDLCRETWGVPLHDLYSAQEVGYIALQCSDCENYHVQAEAIHVEVLNALGGSCRAGEIGRVVVTPLYNFAMPLLRYAIGDYAEVGEVCQCGRGLPVLRRILGRTRNMLTLPSGDKLWPRLSELRYAEILPVEQFQMVQTSLSGLEVRLVTARRATAEEESRLRDMIVARIGHPFEVRFSYPDRIERSAAGKFEDFRSELPIDHK